MGIWSWIEKGVGRSLSKSGREMERIGKDIPALDYILDAGRSYSGTRPSGQRYSREALDVLYWASKEGRPEFRTRDIPISPRAQRSAAWIKREAPAEYDMFKRTSAEMAEHSVRIRRASSINSISKSRRVADMHEFAHTRLARENSKALDAMALKAGLEPGTKGDIRFRRSMRSMAWRGALPGVGLTMTVAEATRTRPSRRTRG